MRRKKIFALPVGSRTYLLHALMFLLAVCWGCSGGGSSDSSGTESAKVIVEPNQIIQEPTVQRTFDVYRATNADKAILFLHAGGGTKHDFAYQLGINLSIDDSSYDSVNKQMLLENKMIAVFPQGESISAAPGATTWNNYVMVSGQDDIQFLRDLVSFIATKYNVDKFYVVGHSMGGVMVNRMWCEAPDLFEAYVAISGPPSGHFLAAETPCLPAQVKPYFGIVGAQDSVLQVSGNWEAQTWTINPLLTAGDQAFVDTVLIGERYFLPARVAQRCGGTVQPGDADAITDGQVTTWLFCDSSIKLMRVEFGGHSLISLKSESGHSMMEFILDFIR